MLAAGHEINGLALYRTGRWRQAAQSLELARQVRPDPALLPVLADCYRAMKRWSDVEAVWRDVKEASPPHEVIAEGRIVAAGALADQGDLKGAIALMDPSQKPPKKVREHHLRQWYVLADLLDRAGDTMGAVRWFREVASRTTSSSPTSATDCAHSAADATHSLRSAPMAKPHFRAGVVTVVRRDDGCVMAFERSDLSGEWQLPAGWHRVR